MRQTTAYQLNIGTQRVASACGQQITEHFTVEEFERSSTADRLGIATIHISISHERHLAVAHAIAER